MRNKFSFSLALFFALAGCGETPTVSTNGVNMADNGTAANTTEPVAPASNAQNMAVADPAASQIDFAALGGRWKVTGVAVGGGVQALVRNDPAYMGQVMDVSADKLAWAKDGAPASGATLSDSCEGPVTARQEVAAAKDYDGQFSAQLAQLKITKPDPHAVECDGGNWGPEAAGGAILFPAGKDRIAMSWYDNTMLLLERQPAAK